MAAVTGPPPAGSVARPAAGTTKPGYGTSRAQVNSTGAVAATAPAPPMNWNSMT